MVFSMGPLHTVLLLLALAGFASATCDDSGCLSWAQSRGLLSFCKDTGYICNQVTAYNATSGRQYLSFCECVASASDSSGSSSTSSAIGAVITIAIIAAVIACCCYNCSCCPWYKSRNRYVAKSSTSMAVVPAAPSYGGQMYYHHATPQQAHARVLNKITVAVATMERFLRAVMSTSDRCTVDRFNNQYACVVDRGNEDMAVRGLHGMLNTCNGGTHLWDAIVVSVGRFLQTGADRPWVLIILTDGDDQGSQLPMSDAIKVLRAYNTRHDNFCVVVGLGNQVNAATLGTLAEQSGSLFMPAEHTQLLDLVFAIIALQVVEHTQVDLARVQHEGAEAIFARVQRLRATRRQAIDLLILTDVSGSMADAWQ